jgi:histidinol-phosphate aminotransferase
MDETPSLGRAAASELARRGFTRRQMLRVAMLASAASALPFSSERALAQLSNAGALPDDAVKINANEFPEGPSARALEALAEVARKGNRYQYPETEGLVSTAARLEGLKPENFSVYPGSSLALHHAVIAFTGPKRALVTAEPGYEAAERAAEFIGAKVVRVPLRRDGAHDLPAMLAAAKSESVGLFYVCNPNNPTGTVTPRSDIESLVANKPAGSVVLLDEAYIHFCDEKPGSDFVRDRKDVVVLRTFSKIFGMAGIRCGYGIAQAAQAKRMDQQKAWDSMNVVALAGARASLGDTQHVIDGRKRNSDTRNHVVNVLTSAGYEVVPSQANFFMVNIKRDVRPVIQSLRGQGVHVGRLFPAMPQYLRVTVGKPDEMQAFMTAFHSVMV